MTILDDSQLISASTGKLDHDLLSACIHCGLCLPACPTYMATGRESESPRGRIYLLSLIEKGELPFDSEAASHIESCLGCLGCQTACPSGVRYEEILNTARPGLKANRSPLLRFILRIGFNYILTNYFLLRLGGHVFRAWQKVVSRLFPLKARSSINHLLHPTNSFLINRLRAYAAFLPPVPPQKEHPVRRAPDLARGQLHQLFSGCVMDVLYNQVNHATADLLVMQGCPVERRSQSCCGALAFHAGEEDIARRLAKENIQHYEGTEGKIVVTSAGCGAMLKEYGHLLKDDSEWRARAAEFSSRVVDVVEVLDPVQIDVPVKAAPAASVAYHAACHLAHAQGIRVDPQRILAALKNKLVERQPQSFLRISELHEAEHCCGSAGIYNVINTELSMKVLARKMQNIVETKAEVVVTTNPGCLLQLNAGAELSGSNVKVMHLAEFMRRAYPDT